MEILLNKFSLDTNKSDSDFPLCILIFVEYLDRALNTLGERTLGGFESGERRFDLGVIGLEIDPLLLKAI